MNEQIEKQEIDEMAKVIEGTEKIAMDSVGVPPSPTMYAKDLYWHGYRRIPDNIGEFSDGYHTFNELYHHRAVLFCKICELFPELAWKSLLHDTGDMYDGMFIVGIDTEYGQATYHFDIDPYWYMFGVKELEKAPKWDGHTPAEAIERIDNMRFKGYTKQIEGEWIAKREMYRTPTAKNYYCSICEKYAVSDTFLGVSKQTNYCPNCGAHMKRR